MKKLTANNREYGKRTINFKGITLNLVKTLLFIICFLTLITHIQASDEEKPLFLDNQSLSFRMIGFQVASVKYRCDGVFSEDEARRVTLVQPGKPYSRADLKKSIENIYYLGGFSDIQVEADLAVDGINLTFILTKQIKINRIEIIGNEKLSNEAIFRIIRLKRGGEYSESIARMDMESIQRAYISQGYVNVSVTFSKTIDQNAKLANIRFSILEGKKPVIADIILLGTTKDAVRDVIGTNEKALERIIKDNKYGKVYQGQRSLDSDAKLIENRYRERGYITARIRNAFILWKPEDIEQYNNQGVSLKSKRLSELKEGEGIIFIQMEQGKKVYIKVIVESKEVRDSKITESIAARKMGSVSESVLRKSAEDVANYYRAKGYYLVKSDEPLILEDKSWEFDIDNDTEGWSPSHESTTLEVSDRSLKISSSSKIPQIQSPKIDIDTNIYNKIFIRMKSKTGDYIRIYWSESHDKWNRRDYIDHPLTSNNQFQTYSINMNWKRNKVIRQIQIEPVNVPETELEIAFIKITTDYIPIVFNVTKNQKMRINDISFIAADGGETEIPSQRISKQILTRKKHPLAFWVLGNYLSRGIFDDVIFQTDLRAIIALYKDQGYAEANIDGLPDIKLNEDKGKINITIKLNEGLKTVVGKIILEGNDENIVSSEEILSNLSIIENYKAENIIDRSVEPPIVIYENKSDATKAFREEDIVNDRSYMRSRYADEGYNMAQIEPVKSFNGDNTKVAITYKITPGKMFRVAQEIDITGNNRTKPNIIKRELSDVLVKDRIFSRIEIAKSWQRLYDLGIFENVMVDAQPVAGYDDLYKMSIDVKEKNAISANLHIGFSSAEEFRGGIELSHINILGTNRRIKGKALLGTEGARGEINYIEPKIFGTSARGFSDLYRRYDRRYEETWTGGDAGLRQTFYRFNTITLNYRYDIVEYGQDEARIGRIETSLQRDTRKDNPLNPNRGMLHSITLEYANKYLMGNENFTKFSINDSVYIAFPLNSVLALSALSGYAWGLGDEKRVLTPLQFNLGEYNTPRGYKWDKEDAGNVLMNLSAELRFPIYKILGGALFFDTVFLGDKISDFRFDEFQSSFGGGLRFSTPIGPARLDYGYPIRGNGKRNLWPQIAFGHAF